MIAESDATNRVDRMEMETETKTGEKKLRLDMTPSQWGMLMGIVMVYLNTSPGESHKKQIDELMESVQNI